MGKLGVLILLLLKIKVIVVYSSNITIETKHV
jgi:hypothetical protein